MIVLQAQELEKSYGVDLIFSNLSLIIEDDDKIALVGPNGAGKSTLLKCLTGEEKPDQGLVTLGRGLVYGYLPQRVELEDLSQSAFELVLGAFQDLLNLRQQLRLQEEAMSVPSNYQNEQQLNKIMGIYANLTARYEMEGGYTFEARVREVLTGLGFTKDEWERPVATFSGGQKTRLALARLLAREPDLLLLDEPTNYLDLPSVEWLEEYLQQYRGALLVVSHDRYFLDAVVTKVLELAGHRCQKYTGNYSEYAIKKATAEAAARKAYALQQVRIDRLTAYINRHRAGIKARQAKGRETRLEKMTRLENPKEQHRVKMGFSAGVTSGNQVLAVRQLAFGYGDQPLFKQLNLALHHGERVALVGANGSGKTTLLKLILGLLPAKEGTVTFGSRVKWGYFAQEGETLDARQTVLDAILTAAHLTVEEGRRHLARFLFRDDELEKKVGVLSGGEKSRLALAQLMLTGANFLLLDEPTNHLDMETRQVLEDALQDFSGTILMVSHDRYFINQVANQVWELEQRQIHPYLGDYDYYRWKKEELKAKADPVALSPVKAVPRSKRPVPKPPKLDAGLLEEQITVKEARLEELAQALGEEKLYGDPEQVKAVQAAYQALEEELPELYDLWAAALDEKG